VSPMNKDIRALPKIHQEQLPKKKPGEVVSGLNNTLIRQLAELGVVAEHINRTLKISRFYLGIQSPQTFWFVF